MQNAIVALQKHATVLYAFICSICIFANICITVCWISVQNWM